MSLQDNHIEPFLALLLQLRSVSAIFHAGNDPLLLFHFTALTRLTRLGLPAPNSSSMDGAFHLLQHLPKLTVLAVGNVDGSSVTRDLPALRHLTQLRELCISTEVTVTLPPRLCSLAFVSVGSEILQLQLPVQLTHLGIWADVPGTPQLVGQPPPDLATLALMNSHPGFSVSILTSLTKVLIDHDLLTSEYTQIRYVLALTVCALPSQPQSSC